MKRTFPLVLGGLLVVLVACHGTRNLRSGTVPRMTKEELKALLGKPGVSVLDVREDGDWRGSDRKLAGALREEPFSPDSWMAKYPKDQTVVLYCA